MASELPDQDDVDQEFMGLRRLQRDLNIEQDPRKKHAMREDLIESLFDYERELEDERMAPDVMVETLESQIKVEKSKAEKTRVEMNQQHQKAQKNFDDAAGLTKE
ncbi:MAG: hypothetical protein L6R39_006329 [Caloplaca ligustica]|nr:MAG: hypothetical protein L6R39_006329 [Caloplaca ligustica]